MSRLVARLGELLELRAEGPGGDDPASVERRLSTIVDRLEEDLLRRLAPQMLDAVPTNVMFSDLDHVVRYANPASIETLRGMERYLPIRADELVGTSIDRFHRRPSHQRSMLDAPEQHLPVRTRIQVGEEEMELVVAPVYDRGRHAGTMVSWALVTDRVALEREISESSQSQASAVAELEASIGEIERTVQRSSNIAGSAAASAGEAREVMAQLNEASTQIATVVDFITDVAQQTNLLALNATIEAARAGETGRGFAVVANEVKELAGQTDQATEKIRASINLVQQRVDDAQASIEEIDELTDQLNEVMASIVAAITEQGSTTQEIARVAEIAAAKANEAMDG
ncbi:MAG: methyl-accepting chemotaxis protein [Actinomycetota bacterium]|nr:methyl-accepting chemotaxis protein [Actinomycetota bacterium]